MRHLAILLLLALLITLPSCKFLRDKGLFNKKAKALAALVAQQDSIRVADSIRMAQERLLALENARLESIRLAEEQKISDSRFKYNIIVGSFITPEFTVDWVNEYRKRGYDPQVIKLEGSQFELVAAESHENFNIALARLIQFQDTVQIDTWLYIKP